MHRHEKRGHREVFSARATPARRRGNILHASSPLATSSEEHWDFRQSDTLKSANAEIGVPRNCMGCAGLTRVECARRCEPSAASRFGNHPKRANAEIGVPSEDPYLEPCEARQAAHGDWRRGRAESHYQVLRITGFACAFGDTFRVGTAIAGDCGCVYSRRRVCGRRRYFGRGQYLQPALLGCGLTSSPRT